MSGALLQLRLLGRKGLVEFCDAGAQIAVLLFDPLIDGRRT